MCYDARIMKSEEALFLRHERFRRVERLFRAGYKPQEIVQRERIPLHVVESIVKHLVERN